MCGLSLRTIQRIEKTGISSNETLASLSSVLEVDKSLLVLSKPRSTMIRENSKYSALASAKKLYSHLLMFSASLLFIFAYIGLTNSSLDTRIWLLVACISSACSLFTLSLTRRDGA